MRVDAPRTLIGVLVLVVSAGALALGLDLQAEASDYRRLPEPLGRRIIALRIIAIVAAAAAMIIALARRRRLGDLSGRPTGPALRVCGYGLVVALTTATLLRARLEPDVSRHLLRSVLYSTLLIAESAWLTALVVAPRTLFRRPKRALAWLDVGLVNACAALLLVEVALGAYARVSPSPLLAGGDDPKSTVDAHKLTPGEALFGFPANSQGYYDEEFFRAEEDDLVVALVADSFGVGVVPHAYNFATVAENVLRARLAAGRGRVAVHDFGVNSIGMTAYAWIIKHEVPAVNPRWVVLAVFVGNDLSGFRRHKTRFHTLQDWRTFSLASRLLAVRREAAAGGRVAEIGIADVEVPDHVLDPSLERPSFSEERFLAIELERMERCDPDDARIARYYAAFFDALDAIHERVGERLIVALIPDEYQVNDSLYERLRSIAPRSRQYDRELPQKRVLAHCEARGMACLDLLPSLQASEADGHVYHRRDTHWNARGNRVAGERIGSYIATRSASQRRGSVRATGTPWK